MGHLYHGELLIITRLGLAAHDPHDPREEWSWDRRLVPSSKQRGSTANTWGCWCLAACGHQFPPISSSRPLTTPWGRPSSTRCLVLSNTSFLSDIFEWFEWFEAKSAGKHGLSLRIIEASCRYSIQPSLGLYFHDASLQAGDGHPYWLSLSKEV